MQGAFIFVSDRKGILGGTIYLIPEIRNATILFTNEGGYPRKNRTNALERHNHNGFVMDSGDKKLLKQVTDALIKGERIFLSGAAGTGKTWLVKRIARQIAKKEKVVYVTASTGIAASLLFDEIGVRQSFFIKGPSTLHSAAMLPWSSEKDKTRLIERGKRRLTGTDVIIIDEISMLDSNTFGRFLDRIPDYTGILVVGDLFQLPPVAKDENSRPDFIFNNNAFKDFKLIELTKNYRQGEVGFLSFLNDLRHGQNPRDFYLTINSEFDQNHPTLFGTRREAAYKNSLELSKLSTKLYTSKCNVKVGDPEKAIKWFENYTRALQICEFKRGMRVLCIKNHDNLVNGDLGTIIDISGKEQEGIRPEELIIEFDRKRIGNRIMQPYEFKKEIQDSYTTKVEFIVEQFPIVPAYGLTVHKAQGMTLDIVNIDGRKINFDAGQVYVAISRCRTKKGLRIQNANMFNAFTRKSVDEYYTNANRLQFSV